MIVIVNLICPNGHPVYGQPVAYAGTKKPPESWCERAGARFMRSMRKNPPLPCAACGATFNPNSTDRGHLAKWGVSVHEMKAKTMQEAHAALKTCAQMFTVKTN